MIFNNARLALILSTALAPMTAHAQTCAGVEARVNSATAQLQAAVQGAITTAQSALIAEETRQRTQLLSAVKVLTSQSSIANDQTTTAATKSTQASASSLVAQNYNQAVADAAHKYSSVGYDPCGSNKKTNDLYNAIKQSDANRRQIISGVVWKAGEYGEPGDWSAAVRNGKAFDGASLYSGDATASTAFINVVAGPPDRKNSAIQGTAEGDQERLNKAHLDANKSVAVVALADIAADYAPDGPNDKLRALTTHWISDDGGEKWAASLAGQHARGVLQDAVRMEAAQVAVLAQQVKKGVRTEMAAASVLLATVNAKIINLAPPLVKGVQKTSYGR